MKGYTGKILFVDLGTGKTHEEAVPDRVYEKYLAGVGLGAWVLQRHIPPKADPLGPRNMLGFVAGIISGLGGWFSGRWMAVARSPLTGGWGEANCGGTLAAAIKRCGYDGIFFTGISKKPVYLYIDDDGIELRDASALWGRDTVETEEYLLEHCGSKKRAAVACIGMAGEKLSLIAGISNERGRMAGRSGLGAVMGSKRLKAVVLAGSKKVEAVNAETLRALSKTFNENFVRGKDIPKTLPSSTFRLAGLLLGLAKSGMRMDGAITIPTMKRWGTIASNQLSVESGDAPIKNWAGSRRDFNAKYVNPDRILKREKKKYHCQYCPVGCGGICETSDIEGCEYTETHKPEYETVTAFGALNLNRSMDSIFIINEMLNRAGMDSISAGSTVAFASECFENGLLTLEDTGGLRLTWGNAPAIVELVKKMIAREGIGDLLADGVRVAAAKIGKGAEQYAIHAGGQELPMHDPRCDPGFGVHYSVEPMPGRHTAGAQQYYELYGVWAKVNGYPAPPATYPKDDKYKPDELKAIGAKANSLLKQVMDGAGVCMFGGSAGVQRYPIFEYLNAATGWERTPEEYMETGRRIQTLKQMFNIRHGINPWDFKIHPRAYGNPPLKSGLTRGRSFDIDQMMKDYWRVMGWDAGTGIPTHETLKALEMEKDI